MQNRVIRREPTTLKVIANLLTILIYIPLLESSHVISSSLCDSLIGWHLIIYYIHSDPKPILTELKSWISLFFFSVLGIVVSSLSDATGWRLDVGRFGITGHNLQLVHLANFTLVLLELNILEWQWYKQRWIDHDWPTNLEDKCPNVVAKSIGRQLLRVEHDSILGSCVQCFIHGLCSR